MRRELAVIVGVISASLGLAGCQLKDTGDNVVNGKTVFAEKCGTCHVLERAGATGTTGPDLDAAFRQSRVDGLGESTFQGVVLEQILYPNRNPQLNPENPRETTPQMPANIVTGQDARDVAAYVAYAAGKPGEDGGRLAAAGVSQSDGTAEAENGVLDIPVAARGLAYRFADAKAPAGSIQVKSENPQSTPHDIAVEGNGVNEEGPVVNNGGVSEVDVDLEPGEYTFYCSVEGHREGGMEGQLTVE